MRNLVPDIIICLIIGTSLAVVQLVANFWRLLLGGQFSEQTLAQLADKYSQEYGWLIKLALNCFGYCCVFLPAILIYKYTKAIHYLERNDNNSGGLVPKTIRYCLLGHIDGGDSHGILPTTSSHLSVEKAATKRKTAFSEGVLLIYCFLGLMVSYLIWGLLQEKIMTQEYVRMEGDKEVRTHFKESQFLVFANRILAFIISGAYLLVRMNSGPRHRAPLYKYSVSSLSNILSAWFQYEALKFVNFPTQVLAKSCKIIPVMLMGKIISRTKYQFYEYVTAIMISLGMICFMMGSADESKASAVTTLTGVFLLCLYMVSDSFTSNWQGELFKTYSMTSMQMMFGVNMFSCLFTASSLFVQSGFMDSVQFALQHPAFLNDVLLLSTCAAIGQLFIFFTIATFGPVVFTIIMTLRQAIAILLSCLIYKHRITVVGIAGIVLVFLAVFLRVYCNQRLRRLKRGLRPGSAPTKDDVIPLFEPQAQEAKS